MPFGALSFPKKILHVPIINKQQFTACCTAVKLELLATDGLFHVHPK